MNSNERGKVLNWEAVAWQQRVRYLEEEICLGKRVINSVTSYESFKDILKDLIHDGQELYDNASSPEDVDQLNEFLKGEISFLQFVNRSIEEINQYHHKHDDISDALVAKEWSSFQVLVVARNYQQQLIKMRNDVEHYDDTQYRAIYNQFKGMYDQVSTAVAYLETHDSNELNPTRDKDEYVAIFHNKELYNKLSLGEQIKCVESYIEYFKDKYGNNKLPWRKRKQYRAAVANLEAKRDNLYRLYDQQEKQALAQSKQVIDINEAEKIEEEMQQIYVDSYFHLSEVKQEIIRSMEVLQDRALNEKDENCVSIKVCGESFKVLKTDLEEVGKIGEKANAYNERCEELEAAVKKTEDRKEDILNELYFLENSHLDTQKKDQLLKALLKEYYSLYKKSQFKKARDFEKIFEKNGFSKEESAHLASISCDIFGLEANKRIPDEEKSADLDKIATTMNQELETETEQEEVKDHPLVHKAIEKTAYLAAKGVCALKTAKKNTKQVISKIKAVRKPEKAPNKDKFKKRVVECALVSTAALFLVVGAYQGHSRKQNNQVAENNNRPTIESETTQKPVIDELNDLGQELLKRTNLAYILTNYGNFQDTAQSDVTANYAEGQEQTAENVSDSVSEQPSEEVQTMSSINLGDTFTVKNDDMSIYVNQYDASSETNGKSMYFDADSTHKVTGITYNYNGALVFLDETDPDFTALKASLESKGAKPVAVRSQNELSTENGYEGFYNLDDIQLGGLNR